MLPGAKFHSLHIYYSTFHFLYHLCLCTQAQKCKSLFFIVAYHDRNRLERQNDRIELEV